MKSLPQSSLILSFPPSPKKGKKTGISGNQIHKEPYGWRLSSLAADRYTTANTGNCHSSMADSWGVSTR